MIVKINEVLKKQNKSKYWLSKKTEFSYPNLSNLCNNKTQSIKFWVIDEICNALNCKLDDILEIEKPTK
jgi:putative transcriptional regulator